MSFRLVIPAVVVLIIGAGCGDTESGDVPLTTSTTPAATTPPTAPPTALETDAGVTEIPDGDHLVLIHGASEDGTTLSVDLAVWFTGEAANDAATEDGVTDVPVPNDYYIRNADPTVIDVGVSPDVTVTSVWFNHDTDPVLDGAPITYDEFLAAIGGDIPGSAQTLVSSPWWAVVANGEITSLAEQYIP